MFSKRFYQSRHARLQHVFMDQQRFHGTTNTIAIGFSIFRNGDCFVDIGRFIDIDVADAIKVLDNRHTCLLTDARHQALATTRNDHINVIIKRKQGTDSCTIGGFNQLHRGGRQTGRSQALLHTGGNRSIASKCF